MPFEAQRAAGGGRQDGNGVADALHSLNRARARALDDTGLAKALGWVSLALGLSGALAPRSTARLIGAGDDDVTHTALQLVGVRELISGIGILTNPGSSGWVWSRVAGDAMDLALLGTAFGSDRADPSRLGAATATVAAITLLDLYCADRLSAGGNGRGRAPLGRGISRTAGLLTDAGNRAASTVSQWTGGRPVHVIAAITVKASPQEIYRFWRDVENLPRVMDYLEQVRRLDDRRSHWVAKGPLGSRIEWESEITEDEPDKRIGWRSRSGAALDNRGTVSFEAAPADRGTIVKVELDYRPPGGAVGTAFAKLLGNAPDQAAESDLRRFKQIMETGEILESDATVKGMGAGRPPAELPERVRGRAALSGTSSTATAEGHPT